jgi:hypothetical protein
LQFVARIERSEIRERLASLNADPDFAVAQSGLRAERKWGSWMLVLSPYPRHP